MNDSSLYWVNRVEYDAMPWKVAVVTSIVSATFALLGALTNGLVMYLIAQIKRYEQIKNMDILILCLCFSDFLSIVAIIDNPSNYDIFHCTCPKSSHSSTNLGSWTQSGRYFTYEKTKQCSAWQIKQDNFVYLRYIYRDMAAINYFPCLLRRSWKFNVLHPMDPFY